jgi:hypothetical protein
VVKESGSDQHQTTKTLQPSQRQVFPFESGSNGGQFILEEASDAKTVNQEFGLVLHDIHAWVAAIHGLGEIFVLQTTQGTGH